MNSPISAREGQATGLEQRVERLVATLARWIAIAGGVVLTVLAVLTLVSVTGRALTGIGLGPVPGDFELVEVGCAFAVFAFLPWCQLHGGHATVDIFVARLGPRSQAWLEVVHQLLMTLFAVVIAWQLHGGLADRLNYNETTLILQLPTWYGYAAALVGAWLFVLVCLLTTWRSLRSLRRLRERKRAA
ncbi:MAG TPA: TRAP transporter small permease [Gammaproteobacteria bacterium]